MKKLFFILIALMVSVGTMHAQQTKGNKGKGNGNGQRKNLTPEEKADKIINRLKAELTLTENQLDPVKKATLTRLNQVEAAKAKAGEDKKAFGQERKKIFQSWETELKGILTPDQYNAYLAKKEEKKKKIQEKRGNKQPVEDHELED